MFKTLANAWKIPELRKKLLYTLLLLAIFRFGAFVTAPGVDAELLSLVNKSSSNTIVGTVKYPEEYFLRSFLQVGVGSFENFIFLT